MSGFMELLPRQQAQFERVKGVLEETYARYGFTPLDTPAMAAICFSVTMPAPLAVPPHVNTETVP